MVLEEDFKITNVLLKFTKYLPSNAKVRKTKVSLYLLLLI